MIKVGEESNNSNVVIDSGQPDDTVVVSTSVESEAEEENPNETDLAPKFVEFEDEDFNRTNIVTDIEESGNDARPEVQIRDEGSNSINLVTDIDEPEENPNNTNVTAEIDDPVADATSKVQVESNPRMSFKTWSLLVLLPAPIIGAVLRIRSKP